MTVDIRTIRQADVAKMSAALAPEVSSAHVRMRWQEHEAGHREMLVAELHGQIAGTVSVGGGRYHLPNSLRLFALDVGPAFRRRGVGTALVKAVEARARGEGVRSVNLEVATENGVAIGLYERLGYRRQGRPIVDRWSRLADDGSCQPVEELSWIMIGRV